MSGLVVQFALVGDRELRFQKIRPPGALRVPSSNEENPFPKAQKRTASTRAIEAFEVGHELK
jgi:hypothetical protein